MPLEKITTQQMDAKGVCAAPDILNGTPAQNKSIFDRMVRELIAPAYNAAVDAIAAIEQTETGIEAAEDLRVAAENLRASAEAAREQAESGRGTAEEARAAAESLRASAEELRASAEELRASAEQARAAAEQNRVAAEAQRKANETQRIENENARIEAERDRSAAEGQRSEAETLRANAESVRIESENTRVTNEKQRIENENTRVIAEDQRVIAEAARNVWEDYNEAKAYVPGNKVYWNGNSYVCLRECAGVTPENASYWQTVVHSGFTEDSLFSFDVVGGRLICYYQGDNPPPFHIGEDGHLYADTGSGKATDLGKVTNIDAEVADAEAARDKAKEYADAAAESAAVYDTVVADVTQLKQDIEKMRFGDPYDGVDLTSKFSDEISGYTDPGAWIRARIRANNFDGIHVNDYIPFTTTHGLKFKARVAGIDTYYMYGDSSVGHHIDWICEELWPTPKPINPVNYNNGLIPTENITTDGTTAQYALTKPMYGVEKVTHGGVDLTGWTYDNESCTLSFSTAPDAGTITVTGTGSEYPWLSCDAYLYANSLAGHVANGTGANPDIKRVDYTNDGIYNYLPDWLKAVIIEKRFMLAKRYSATGILSDDNSWGWTNIGKLWFPTEPEVYGMPVWGGKSGYSLSGSAVQYPIFMGNMNRLKYRSGRRDNWWLLSPDTSSMYWCSVYGSGFANAAVVTYTNVAVPVCFRIG